MIISLIAAMDENRVIGWHNRMPWKLPNDRKRFHDITKGHSVIMGRKTYESIGRALPQRQNIVITRQAGYCAQDCLIANDLASALAACGAAGEVFILGGEDIFIQAMPIADRIYLTLVHTRSDGDAFFPEILGVFAEVSRESAKDTYPVEFIIYERKKE
jgi:dihydrofolate reductase